jgi:cytosine/adenosine deaminase-related metal-dependent hydrolase
MSGRHSVETAQAMEKMREGLNGKRGGRRLTFQGFVAILLIVLVIITTTSFVFTMRSERDARERAEARAGVFRVHVQEILDEIQTSQLEAHEERQAIYNQMIELLADH